MTYYIDTKTPADADFSGDFIDQTRTIDDAVDAVEALIADDMCDDVLNDYMIIGYDLADFAGLVCYDSTTGRWDFDPRAALALWR